MTPPTSSFDVVCYVRASAGNDTVDGIIETLRGHERAGRLGSLTVRSWPSSVALEGTRNRDVVETVEAFREWAAERAASLEPAFSVTERVSEFTGARETRLRLPVVCLAVYEDGELYSVVPNRTPERACTVPKALDVVEANEEGELDTLAGAPANGSSVPS